MRVKVDPAGGPFVKRLKVPSDKSITHRAFMLASIAKGISVVERPLLSRDCVSTLNCLGLCGADIKQDKNKVKIVGGLSEPVDVLNAGNSGTTARLLMGLLAGYPFFCVITGDESLRKRPMGRVVRPLSLMGVSFMGRGSASLLPLAFTGGRLRGIRYHLPVASAQVKSAILLAALRADGPTKVVEPVRSRDHTERMLSFLGVPVRVSGLEVEIEPASFEGFCLKVPGDPSSAAYWVAAAVLVPGSEVVVEEVLLNPTRIGFLEVLKSMGAQVEWEVLEERMGEPVGRIVARFSSDLMPFEVDSEVLPSLIDEVPLLALVATRAQGTSVIRGASELRVKESDRIRTTVEELSRLGAHVEELEDGMVIEGPVSIRGGVAFSHGDHRIAMMLAIAGLISKEGVEIEGAQWVDISYPGFFDLLL